MKDLINTAIQLRKPIISDDTNAYRLFDGDGDGAADVVVDSYDGHWVVSRKMGGCPQWLHGAGAKSLWLKLLEQGEKSAPVQIEGATPEMPFLIRENGVCFEIDLAAGYSQGIFLDQRLNRRRVGERVRERGGGTLLNTFAYTCGFSAVAAAAGATTTSIDLSGNYLNWGKRNLMANGCDPGEHYFVKGDVQEWLRQFAKKGRKFDGVVLDPPTFSRVKGGKGVFRVEKDYALLVELAAKACADGGWMLCCTNHRTLEPWRFEAMVEAGLQAAGRGGGEIEDAEMPPEFSDEPYLKSLWVQF
ncbi:MAG: class I SAM-dependent methyltransferase [Verrucomicrobiales bacterium]